MSNILDVIGDRAAFQSLFRNVIFSCTLEFLAIDWLTAARGHAAPLQYSCDLPEMVELLLQ